MPEEVWLRRHRLFLAFLLLHALFLGILSYFTGHTVLASLAVGAWITLFVLLGAMPRWSRKLRASWVSLGLVTSSALLVHLSGGYIEMHFHYFVMVTFLALYQDWTPFLLAVGYVLFQHGIGGYFFPQTVYNHHDAWVHPWKWAFIHAAFLSASCIGVIIAWRANESSRARMENLLNSSAEGFLGVDLVGRIAFANPAIEELTGYSIPELMGRPIDVLFFDGPESDISGSRQGLSAIQRALDSASEAYIGEVTLRLRDGSQKIVECRSGPLKDRMELSGIVLTLIDITARKEAEEAARASEKRFRSVTQSANDAIVSADDHGRMMSWNRGAQVMFGYRETEVLGRPLALLMPERYRLGHQKGLERMRTTGESHIIGKTVELHGLRKDGTEFPLEVSLSTWKTGNETFYSGIIRDITERKRGENAVRESEEQFRLLVGSLKDYAVLMLDPNGHIVSWNEGAERIKGYRPEEILGQHFSRFYTDEDIQAGKPARALKSAEDEGAFEDSGGWRLRKNGSRFWANVVITAIRDQAGTLRGFTKVTRDITERKHLEEELRQSQKMEAIGSLAGGIAHDFNNLLMVITGYSQLLLDRLGQNDPSSVDIKEIKQAGERAASLTQQLLAFSRRQTLTPEMLNLNTILAGMGNMLQRLIGENIHLVIRPTPALGMVKADRGQIEQVLMNLAVNARDAMTQGGQLTIETANVDMNPAQAIRVTLKSGEYVRLAVTDTGCGMDTATQARIFEPFFTTKEQGKGTGLGLSTVHGIVNQSKGSILVESVPGKGSTFTIYLPRLRDEVTTAPGGGAAPAGLARGSETVLVVEDEKIVRGLLCKVLQANGYAALEAGSGQEALWLSQEHAGPIQLLITDVVMPGMNGRELAQRLMALRPDMKVIFISGYIDDAGVRNGVAESHVNFLQKPIEPSFLVRKIREVLDSS
ncbi:MAG TPA: PAS domain S-box protein [Nitrospiraceae bacterium]|nr:PAS domain S-box protein [Nitrospiraceae bacterium]